MNKSIQSSLKSRVVKAVSLVLDQCVASSVTGPGDLLQTANIVRLRADPALRRTLPKFEWCVAGNSPISSNSGMIITPEKSLQSVAAADIVFVSAIGAYSETAVLDIISRHPHALSALNKAHSNGAHIVGLCTGTFVLAEAGLLNDRESTTSWWLSPKFSARYRDTNVNSNRMITLDDRIICAGAGAAYFDATLAIISTTAGPWLSEMVASYFVVDRRRASQSAYMIPAHLISADPKIMQADRIIRQNISSKINIERLANELALSERSFHRRLVAVTGLSPRAYISAVRMEIAKNLVLSGKLSVDEIAEKVGYLDTNAFRRAFKSEVGMTVGGFADSQGGA